MVRTARFAFEDGEHWDRRDWGREWDDLGDEFPAADDALDEAVAPADAEPACSESAPVTDDHHDAQSDTPADAHESPCVTERPHVTEPPSRERPPRRHVADANWLAPQPPRRRVG